MRHGMPSGGDGLRGQRCRCLCFPRRERRVEGPRQELVHLDVPAGGSGEADGHHLWQASPHVDVGADTVRRDPAHPEGDGQRLRAVVVGDLGGQGLAGLDALVGRDGLSGEDGVDVDADVVAVHLPQLGVLVRVELDRHHAVVAAGVPVGAAVEEAQVPAVAAAGRRAGRVVREEERHPVRARLRRVRSRWLDQEGEGGGEAGQLAGGAVPEGHRLRVRQPADAVVVEVAHDVLGQLDRVLGAVEVGVAGAGQLCVLRGAGGIGVREVETERERGGEGDVDGGQQVAEAAQPE